MMTLLTKWIGLDSPAAQDDIDFSGRNHDRPGAETGLEGLPMPREPAFADQRRQDAEAQAASRERRPGGP